MSDGATYPLVLLRHGQSDWNEKNLFTGWVDVGLTELGRTEARRGGELLAERAKAAGIETCVFDRGGYQYHGRVKALAEGAREGGLAF